MLLVAVLAGLFVGLSLGALGGGGSILAVPVLVYILGQTPLEATTASLVIVGLSALAGAVAAHRRGNLKVAGGAVFAGVGAVGAVLGAVWSTYVDPDVLLALFAMLMLVVAVVMARRQLKAPDHSGVPAEVDAPIITVSPTFMCDCPRALKVLVTALAVGVLTGFLGVGGGFLAVPALVLALGLSMPMAVGTSLLVITTNSAVAFAVRVGHGVEIDWLPVGLLTVAAMVGSVAGARVAARIPARTLGLAFAGLLVVVAVYTATQSIPAVI